MDGHDAHGSTAQTTAGHGAHETAEATAGVSLAAGGFALAPIAAPAVAREQGTLSVRILDGSGATVTAYTPQHEKAPHRH